MTLPSLDAVSGLAAEVARTPDDRPGGLTVLRDATHPTTLYYRFLYELCRRHTPLAVLEIGTYCGVSAAHMAWGNPQGSVVTVDIQSDAKVQVDRIGLPNVFAITHDSSRARPLLDGRMFDLIYIDGWHDFNQTYGEYVLFRDLLRDGGLMIFDDVGLPMAGDEMNVFWEFVVDPKVRLDYLHPNTGFGVMQKDPAVTPPPWSAVIDRAGAEIARRLTVPAPTP